MEKPSGTNICFFWNMSMEKADNSKEIAAGS